VHLITGNRYLKRNSRWLGINFEFGCMTVDPQTAAFDPSPLKVYFKELGIPYFYESQQIIEAAQQAQTEVTSICSFCARMKRGRMYACLRREGYNVSAPAPAHHACTPDQVGLPASRHQLLGCVVQVLALGQHLDDLAESFLMSAFHNGFLRTMKASYNNEEGDIRIIRPFVNTRERDIRKFAHAVDLPIIAENCPACFSAPKERARVKQLLAAQVHPCFAYLFPSDVHEG
jgi:tRNA(Ile)-lysidine synthase TilS/MesJ